MRQELARGRRRRLRGDRLLRVLRRRARSRLQAGRTASTCPARRTASTTCRAAWSVVIAPWNFPLAILTGMTAAALVTGNTVVMKPAEQSPVDRRQADGDLPTSWSCRRACSTICPATARWSGAALVEHPDVALIAFTGSRKVGLAINAKAAEVSRQGVDEREARHRRDGRQERDHRRRRRRPRRSGARRRRRARSAIRARSARPARRAIVLAAVYDTFLQRLVEATRSLKIGPAEDPATSVGPVIDEESLRPHPQLHRDRPAAKAALALAVDVGDAGRAKASSSARTSSPTCRRTRASRRKRSSARCWRSSGRPTWTKRCAIANGTDYALTGGMSSPQPGEPRPGPARVPGRQPVPQPRRSPAPWSAGSRSAASRCRASAAKPAAPTTCCNS